MYEIQLYFTGTTFRKQLTVTICSPAVQYFQIFERSSCWKLVRVNVLSGRNIIKYIPTDFRLNMGPASPTRITSALKWRQLRITLSMPRNQLNNNQRVAIPAEIRKKRKSEGDTRLQALAECAQSKFRLKFQPCRPALSWRTALNSV